MQLEFARPTPIPIRKRRLLMVFDSKESAYKWADSHAPRRHPGAIGHNPPRAVNDKEAGGWVLKYAVQMGGHVRYLTMGRGGHLVKQ